MLFMLCVLFMPYALYAVNPNGWGSCCAARLPTPRHNCALQGSSGVCTATSCAVSADMLTYCTPLPCAADIDVGAHVEASLHPMGWLAAVNSSSPNTLHHVYLLHVTVL
jgi:hypothetical protein